MYDLNEQRILEIIFKNPTTKFHLLEIARLSKLHPNTALKTLNKLAKQKMVNQEKKKHIKEICANKENPLFSIKKRMFNLKQVYDSEIIDMLIKKFSPEAISIMGSYSRGEDIEGSDIDIAVISKKDYEAINLEKFEKAIGRKVHLIITDYKKMSNEFYINLINGIIMYGALNINKS